MQYTIHVYLGILIALASAMAPVNASIMPVHAVDPLRHALERALERTRHVAKRCVDSLTHHDAKPLRQRIEPIVPVWVPLLKPIRDLEAFNRARDTFARGFPTVSKQVWARAHVFVLQPRDPQRLDFETLKMLTAKEYPNFTNAQFRDFVLMLIARCQRFDNPEKTIAVFEMLVKSIAKRKNFDSTDIARVQVGMLEATNVFDDYQSLREAFAVIFSSWAFALRHPDLVTVSRVASDIIGTFDSAIERDATILIIDKFENGLTDAF